MAAMIIGALFAQQIPGLPFEKINKAIFLGALFIAALHSFVALRRM